LLDVSSFALSATSFALLPTIVRTFGDLTSHIWRPTFAPLATNQIECRRDISALKTISTGLTYLTQFNIFNIPRTREPTTALIADVLNL
jgi:hypothetical protein